ncbi:MAG: radical SAM protein [Alphaproteobacteria bacterium]|nr:radical SAM protein [Alphaproteobacteria bacterium]
MTAVLVPQHFGSLLFERHTSRYLPFDPESTALLEALAAKPVYDVLDDVPEADRPGVVGLFQALEDRGHATLDGRLDLTRLDVEPPEAHLTGPLAVHLEIMGACNLACTHCFAMPLPRHRDPLGLDELDSLFAQLAAIGSYRLGLTGGEPLLRKDLLDILDRALAHGLHPCLTTNALLLDEALAKALGERRLVWLNVSLEGPDAATNDPVRGEGTFEAVCAKLRMLAEHARYTLAFTITDANSERVEEAAALARDLGASNAVFRPLYPVGAASTAQMPGFDAYSGALERLSACGDLGAIDAFAPTSRAPAQARTYTGPGCGAANLVASIDVSGNVNPCSFLGAGTVAGNVRARPFREIWDEGGSFRRLRAPSQNGFRGGCRARSQAFSGDLDGPDPWFDAWEAGRGQHPLANVEVG